MNGELFTVRARLRLGAKTSGFVAAEHGFIDEDRMPFSDITAVDLLAAKSFDIAAALLEPAPVEATLAGIDDEDWLFHLRRRPK